MTRFSLHPSTNPSTGLRGLTLRLLGLVLAGLVLCAPALADPSRVATRAERPLIAAVTPEGEDLTVVEVRVPAGYRRVTLEARARANPKVWVPKRVAHLTGQSTTVRFRLYNRFEAADLRVRGQRANALPDAFFTGKTRFVRQDDGSGWAYATSTVRELSTAAAADAGTDAGREVQESDIWRVRDNTLYFFNQLRGLQVIDVSDAAAPKLRSSLRMAAAGEQMYLVGPHHAALLVHGYRSGDSGSEVVLVDVSSDDVSSDSESPRVVARLPVRGYTTESRLVGDVLYVASAFYGEGPDGEWESGTQLTAFDLSDPANPVERDSRQFSGYGHVVHATESQFLVVANDWRSNGRALVHVVDISKPDGTLGETRRVRAAGYVADKFKLHVQGEVLSVVSEVWGWDDVEGERSWTLVSRLETFTLGDVEGPRRLGTLDLGPGESLRATRFVGDRAYVVTFFQVDPLWIVDLSDPAKPTIVSHLEIPGFSTYIHPLGDRLVTIGYLDGETAVSLFDVADPAKPAALSQVTLEGFTEANWNEKAFTVAADEGLVLVPLLAGWGGNYSGGRVQLVEIEEAGLKVRGAVDYPFEPRRSQVQGTRILALSGTHLLSIDARNRDNPEVVADLALAWTVDRVFQVGEHLLEIDAGQDWDAPGAVVRVARSQAPETVLKSHELTGRRVVGAALAKGGLVLAHVPDGRPLKAVDAGVPADTLTITVIGTTDLPAVAVLGQVDTGVALRSANEMEALWVQEGVVVWVGREWGYDLPVKGGLVRPLADVMSPARIMPGFWPYWGSERLRMVAVDVSNPSSPKLLSQVRVGPKDDNSRTFGPPVAAGGRVYVTAEARGFGVLPIPRLLTQQGGGIVTGQVSKQAVPDGWQVGHYLHVVDFQDPTGPVARAAVNVPGALLGVAAKGELLYTTSYREPDSSVSGRAVLHLQASAFDGTAAHLVAEKALPDTWEQQLTLAGETVLAARGASSSLQASPALESWGLTESGALQPLGSLGLPARPLSLRAFGALAATLCEDGSVSLVNAGDPGTLRDLGTRSVETHWYWDLRRAVGGLGTGLWVPLGAYGVERIEVPNMAE